MSDKSDRSNLKLIFSVIGVDGKPLEGARIRISRNSGSAGAAPYTDSYTDKDGKAMAEAGDLLMVHYTLSHGYYSASGSGGIGDSDRYFTISFEGFNLLSASFECPGVPDDVPMNLSLCERVFYKTGFFFHPLELTSDLKKNSASGRWETKMYIPAGDFCWTIGAENMLQAAGEVSVKEDVCLNQSLPTFYPVVFTAENTPPNTTYEVQLNDKGIPVGLCKLDTAIYIPQGNYSCRLTRKMNFVGFEVRNTTEPQSVHLDYAVLAKLVPVSIVGDPEKQSVYKRLTVVPTGYPWDHHNFIEGYASNKALPVGTYDYALGYNETVIAVRGVLEVKEGVNNELLVDLSSWQKVTYQAEVETAKMSVKLVDEHSICRSFSQKSSDSFYAAPGTYTLYSAKTQPVKVVVGDSEPEKVMLPPCDEGTAVSCTIRNSFGSNLLNASIKAANGPFLLHSFLGDMWADQATLGKQTFVVSAAGYKTFTCEVDVRKKMDICILLLPE